jgi:hypothetical protein
MVSGHKGIMVQGYTMARLLDAQSHTDCPAVSSSSRSRVSLSLLGLVYIPNPRTLTLVTPSL